jgi:hypothetical protein
VRLGLEDGQLDRRLLALLHLNKNLPKQLGNRRPGSVDLTDPDQPELSVGSSPAPAIANPGTAPGNVAIPSVPPRGAQ